MEHRKGHLAMNTPPILSPQEWEAARQQLLVKEKALTRSRLNRPLIPKKRRFSGPSLEPSCPWVQIAEVGWNRRHAETRVPQRKAPFPIPAGVSVLIVRLFGS
jgi:hypothetical protein